MKKNTSNGLITNNVKAEENAKSTSGDNLNEDNSERPMTPEGLSESKSVFGDWKNEPTIALLREDLEYAREENRDQRANVDGWLAIRNTTGVESGHKSKKKGVSKLQPKLVRKHNEWRYPALSEPFLSTDRMFDVRPRTHEDAAAAKQNETILNWQFDTKIDKVSFVDRMVRKMVDEGTCVLRVGWDRTTEKCKYMEPIYSYYPIEDPQQLELLQEIIGLYQSEDPDYERLPEEVKAAVEYSVEKNTPVYAEKTSEKEVLRDKVIRNQPTAKPIKVKNFFIDPSCEGIWQEAKFMVFTYESTKSKLKKMRGKYKNLDKVDWSQNKVKPDNADRDHESTSPDIDTRTTDDKTNVLVYEYWGEFDVHGTGESVSIVVTFIGSTIIQMEENPYPDKRPPFILIPYMPILESSFGEADASLLQDSQRIIGAVTRGTIDLLARSSNSQTGYAKNFLDAVNKQRFSSGDDFEYNPNADPRTAIQQMKYPELPNSAIQVINMHNQEAEALSGVKAFDSGLNSGSFGAVARGITASTDAAAQRETSIVRRIAEGMRQIGIKFASMNAKFLEESEIVRVTDDEYIEISREDLIGNFDLIVDISTAADDEAKSQDLGFMLQTIGPDMDPGLQGMILSEIADLKRMPDLAERIRTYEPEPDPIQARLGELQVEKLEAEVAYELARAEEATARAENVRNDTQMDASGVRHDRAVQTQGAQARGNRDLEVTKSLLDGQTPTGNIEAAVGFNDITKASDERDSNANQLPPPVQAQQGFDPSQVNLGPPPQEPVVIDPQQLAQDPNLPVDFPV